MKPKYAEHIHYLRASGYETTQQSLADFMGVSKAYVNGIERGVNFPNQNYVDCLCEHMELQPYQKLLIERKIKDFEDATRNIKTGNLNWQQKASVKSLVTAFEHGEIYHEDIDEVIEAFLKVHYDDVAYKDKEC